MGTEMGGLTQELSDKLVKVLALLGSNHAGERDSAAIAAMAMLKASGLNWADVIGSPAPVPSLRGIPPATIAQAVLSSGCKLTAAEMNFALRIAGSSCRLHALGAVELQQLTVLYSLAFAGDPQA